MSRRAAPGKGAAQAARKTLFAADTETAPPLSPRGNALMLFFFAPYAAVARAHFHNPICLPPTSIFVDRLLAVAAGLRINVERCSTTAVRREFAARRRHGFSRDAAPPEIRRQATSFAAATASCW